LHSRSHSEIMLDFDNYSRTGLLRFIRSHWRFLFRFHWPVFGKLRVQHVNVAKTRHGYHVRIRVKNGIPKREMNFLQLALGSDYRRECMNLRRIISCKQMRSWNVLYRLKFNSRGDITSQEKPDARLARKVTNLIEGFQKAHRPLHQLR
jgi:hypothetical protein